MIVVWKGLGVVVIFIGIGVCLLMNVLTGLIFNDRTYFQKHWWPQFASLWLIGLSCWLTGKYFGSRRKRIIKTKKTDAETWASMEHTFFFLKLEYWGLIFFIIGIVFFFAKLW